MNLNLLILIPILTALSILPFKSLKQIRTIALVGAVAQLILSAVLLNLFMQEPNASLSGSMVFESSYAWYAPLHINHSVGIDGIAISMILLTALVVLAGVLVSWQMEKMSREFFFLLMLLSAGAYGYFIATDVFTMFFFLELAVVPKFLLIGIWGSGKKEYSATKLVLMLMGASALVFVGLAGLYFNTAGAAPTFNMSELAASPLSPEKQQFFFPFAFIGFGVFTALFPFHTWVPDGHSSAPTAASMFLAGISMKLGGYGILRVAVTIMPDAAHYYSPYIIVLSAIAILYGSFATMMQTDLKYINAYSSVSHTGFVLFGIGMLTKTAIAGAVIQMVSHGLMTALFFAVIGMVYERTHTREVSKMGGLLKVIPFISTVFVIAGLTSLGLPGFSGFVAEMMVFIGSWENGGTLQRVATIAATASIVVTAVYILRAVGKVIMGPMEDNAYLEFKDARWNEKMAAGILIVGILIIGITPFFINHLITPGTEAIMQKLATATP
ncbi:MAG TPA: NADH-quinone oxidoreductase subunit M [Phnomibacter sp.]|nr:NADH-quinone oxidoreductase subunit M [Phnomibacter sp.]